MIVYDQRWLTIHWDDELKAVRMQWKDYCEGEVYRAGLDAGVALLRDKGAQRWLADLRSLGPVRQDDQDWTNSEWFPRAVEAGVRYMALVIPTTAVARMSVNRIMTRVKNKELITCNFGEYEAARKWLKDPTVTP